MTAAPVKRWNLFETQVELLPPHDVVKKAVGRSLKTTSVLVDNFVPTLEYDADMDETVDLSNSGSSSDLEADDSELFDSSVCTRVSRLPSFQYSDESINPLSSPASSVQSDEVRATPRQRLSTVLVVGVGYVGTHLMERFSSQYDVLAFDVSEARCEMLRKQHADNKNVTFVADIASDSRSETFDLALISVPTLLNGDLTGVETQHIETAVRMVGERARPGSTVVVESSVTVGMTRKLLAPLREKGVFVGFSPERVDPGRLLPLFEDIPKVVAGIDADSLARMVELYEPCFTTVVPVSQLEVAEMTKLYENCQRLVNIAYINEIADACADLGIDVHEVVYASSTKPFGFMPYSPSLGAGGHCIPVNPWYLLSNCDLPLLRQAACANRERPIRKAEEVKRIALESAKNRPQGNRSNISVAILGMGFKRGEASLAYAPTVSLADKLTELGVEVSYIDDFVQSDRWTSVDKQVLLQTPQEIDNAFDAIVVAQRPTADEIAALQRIDRTKVIYFSK